MKWNIIVCLACFLTIGFLLVFNEHYNNSHMLKSAIEHYTYTGEEASNDIITSIHPTDNSEMIMEVIDPQVKVVKAQVKRNASTNCPIINITRRKKVKRSPLACVPHVATKKSCKNAHGYYWQDDALKTCDKETIRICSVFEHNVRTEGKVDIKFSYKCSFDACPTRHITVKGTNEKSRNIEKVKTFSNPSQLEHELEGIGENASSNGFHYLFLECTDENGDAKVTTGQFLQLPSYHLLKYVKANEARKKLGKEEVQRINVNIIWIDSVARSHFIRSLPSTQAMISEINSDKSTKTEVLEFELFQAVHGHTNENIQALNTGEVFPKEWSNEKRDQAAINYKPLMHNFTQSGYWTMSTADLCHNGGWGIRGNLGAHTISEFEYKLERSGIKDTGLYWSNCYMYELIGESNPFQGPDKICYNGRFMDTEFLSYVRQHSEFAARHNVPIFTFSELNVAHDGSGRRVQTFDWDLAAFTKRMSVVENTITVIMADHGNTYTRYQSTLEGKFEMYHPMFAMIIPDSVVDRIGAEAMSALQENQYRLFTVIDVHRTLTAISRWSRVDQLLPRPSGLLSLIAENRTCESLPLKLPNFCVCEGWDVAVAPGSEKLSKAFAIGSLNNKLLAAHAKLGAAEPRKCRRIVAAAYDNVRKRNNGGNIIVTFDFHMPAGSGVSHEQDSFHAEVELIGLDMNDGNQDMKLLNFERVSPYSVYNPCLDSTVQDKLCVCDVDRTKIHNASYTPDISARKLEDENPAVYHVTNSTAHACLYYVTKKYFDSWDNGLNEVMFEAVNKCDRVIDVTVEAEFRGGLRTSGQFPIKKKAFPNGITFLGGASERGDVKNVKFEP